jgi:hypothetical protein
MKTICLLFFSIITLTSSAQDTLQSQGSVKVRKSGNLHSVIYDDVNFRLVCRDIYGNIHDSAVIAFNVDVTVKGIAYSEKRAGSFISKELQQKLGRLDGQIYLVFSEIKAKDKYGNVISFPSFKAPSGQNREREDY